MAQFPANIAPDWITNMQPSERPIVENQFEAGGISRLKVSQVKKGGRFTAVWNKVNCEIALDTIMNFWDEVERHEAVTFTLGFFKDYPIVQRTEILSWSPLGNWRFSDRPRLEMVNNTLFSISATFEAIVD